MRAYDIFLFTLIFSLSASMVASVTDLSYPHEFEDGTLYDVEGEFEDRNVIETGTMSDAAKTYGQDYPGALTILKDTLLNTAMFWRVLESFGLPYELSFPIGTLITAINVMFLASFARGFNLGG